MNKKFLLVAAICAAMNVSGFAQENLAENKTATASSNASTANSSIDGNTGTRWEVSNTEGMDNVSDADKYWFAVDLGEKTEFNTIQILWENNNVKTFDILVSDDGNEWTKVYNSPEGVENAGTKNYSIGDQNARYVKIKATALNGQWYFSFWEFRVIKAEASVLTSLSSSYPFVKLGEATDLGLTAKDQIGNELSDGIKYSSDNGTFDSDNKFTPTKAGACTITATDKNGKEATTTVYALDDTTAPTVPSVNEANVYNIFSKAYSTENNAGWTSWSNGNFYDEIVFDSYKAKPFKNGDKIGIKDLNFINSDGYTNANIDVFATEDFTGTFEIEGAGGAKTQVNLKAGEWTNITINGLKTGYSDDAKLGWMTFYSNSGTFAPTLVANVYLYKGGEVKENVTVASTPNERGFYAVSGYAKSADAINAKLTDKSITAYDLTGLKTEGENLTIKPANPNALIYVAGEGGNDFKPAKTWGDTKNVIGFNGNSAIEWYVPATSIEYTDGYPVYKDFFISAKSGRPLSYSRLIPAGAYVSAFLPINSNIPEGCKAYAFAKGTDDNTIAFEEVQTLTQHTPYIIYNGNSVPATLTFSAEGDVNITTANETTTELNNVTVKGNYSNITGDNTQYVLDSKSYNAEDGTLTMKKCTEKTTIVPFRVYFTLKGSANASEIKFVLPENGTTGIRDINGTTNKSADIYSIDGRLVKKNATSLNGLENGVYIMNGKKYIVK